ncbi:integron integrase [Neptunomonas sp.]|uniref:integron integrase n=1 Tax=Neptunomonas sp. TaxID=1971898 RepID=UPI003562F8BC
MKDVRRPIDQNSIRFMDRLCLHIRTRNLAYTTEKAYAHWILRFIRYHNKQHPNLMGTKEIELFLSYLANQRQCSKSTQRLALNALIYLYREFLQIEISDLTYKMASKPRKLPTVFSSTEAKKVLRLLTGKYALAANLIYGAGLRISEVVALRNKDIDFEMNQIIIRSGKGDKDRITLLPKACIEPLKRQMAIVHSIHVEDLANGHGSVYIPAAEGRNQLRSRKEFAWQYLFSSNAIIIDKTNNIAGRYHIDETVMRKKIKVAIRSASICKDASTHTFRHSFATQCILNGMDIRTLQEIMGHASVSTTQIYLHISEQLQAPLVSPLDLLD